MWSTIITYFFVALIIWWLVLYTQLPRGGAAPGEQDVNEHGAPLQANMKAKLLRTTVITLAIIAFLFVLSQLGVISLFELLTGRSRLG
jgi:predicted secreted protein